MYNLLSHIKSLQVAPRCYVIDRNCVGETFLVHSGLEFISISVSEEMIGFKFGEFVQTRKIVAHDKKKQRQKQKTK